MEKVNGILLVEDNQTNAFLHQQLIQQLDIAHQIWTVDNGQQALAFIEQHYAIEKDYPELILLDINMLIINGLQFFQAFQQFEPEKQSAMKVVVLTTALALADIEKVKKMGLVHINKPLTSQKLKDIWPRHKRNLVFE